MAQISLFVLINNLIYQQFSKKTQYVESGGVDTINILLIWVFKKINTRLENIKKE